MKAVDVHLAAMDVLDVALDGRPLPHEVLARVRPDLEVLSRDDLMRVLATVAANVSFAIGSTHRSYVRQQVSRMRLKAMLDGSPDE